ncbi:MAG: hypothetical protein AAF394_03915 [Planctomycetota bacterium]
MNSRLAVIVVTLTCSSLCMTPPNTAFPEAHADESETLNLLVQAVVDAPDPTTKAALLQGVLAGLAGRRNVPAPEKWKDARDGLLKSENDEVRDLATQLAAIFGDAKAMETALAVVRNKTLDLAQRRSALRTLLEQRSSEASDLLEELLDEKNFALDAIRGYSIVENAAAPKILLGRYAKMSDELKQAVIETLATRRLYATALVKALKSKRVTNEEIPTHVARSLKDLLGKEFTDAYGEVRELAQDREKLIAKYRKLITDEAVADADVNRGRQVFQKTCGACHVMYDAGGKIGPDLTGSNRANLDYFLLNSVDPSYDVPEGYRMVQILTFDDRAVNGVLAEEDDTRIVLKTVEQPRLTIAKDDIAVRKISSKSMMPDGQLDAMKPQQILDLVKYLRTTEQVALPK